MRQLSRSIDSKTGTGFVKLEPTDNEDLWHIYNLISMDDHLRASTIRKVQSESTTGSMTSDRIRLTLTISIKTFEYDAYGENIRISGQIVEENAHVKVGAFHTIELEPNRAFTLSKQFWDSFAIERLDIALDPCTDADLGAIVMEEGLAHILLVSRSLTLTRARIEVTIPRKGKNAIYNRDGAIQKFFQQILNAMEQHVDLKRLKVLLISSPGFVKDEFYNYVNLQAIRMDIRSWIDNKSKVILCHSSSGQKQAFQEIVSKPELQKRLSNTKAVGEVRILNQFREMLQKDETRAIYGPNHVKYGNEMGAIENLLVTDKLFRSANVKMRKEYVELVEQVKKNGGEVNVFSTQHVSGQQLDLMSGVAAILRFPLIDLNEIET